MTLLRTDDDLLKVIASARAGELDDEAIADLARHLAASGQTLKHQGRTADIASTGGPASLSTLLCPVFLRTHGWIVPKLGVPGRPAGGVDVLAQIPGYKVELTVPEVSSVLDRSGYAHFAAGAMVAPLDARLFALRQKTGAQTVASLVVASLLSKKVAVGLDVAGLDIRVAPHGNFGDDFEVARRNANLFRRVASILNIEARCLLTDATRPYQPFIGRGEALLALHQLFNEIANPWLRRHATQCAWMATETGSMPPSPPKMGAAYAEFAANVRAQGGSLDGFESTAVNIARNHATSVLAPTSGFPVIDLNRIRDLIVARQAQAVDSGSYPDPSGVILLAESTQLVAKGDPIMTIRDQYEPNQFAVEIASSVRISDVPPASIGELAHG